MRIAPFPQVLLTPFSFSNLRLFNNRAAEVLNYFAEEGDLKKAQARSASRATHFRFSVVETSVCQSILDSVASETSAIRTCSPI